MHVLEKRLHLREHRDLPLRFHAVDDGGGEHNRFVVCQGGPIVRQALQRSSDTTHFSQHLGARIAPVEMGTDRDLLADRELAIVVCVQAPTSRRAIERVHVVRASRSSSLSACRARVRRDLTVPTATPIEYAISS